MVWHAVMIVGNILEFQAKFLLFYQLKASDLNKKASNILLGEDWNEKKNSRKNTFHALILHVIPNTFTLK